MNQENDIQEKEILAGEALAKEIQEKDTQAKEAQAKKSKKKKKQNGPGHLKERNHFDGKDMILLVVMLIIIYGIMTWVEFFAEQKQESLNHSTQTVTESVQESKTADE